MGHFTARLWWTYRVQNYDHSGLMIKNVDSPNHYIIERHNTIIWRRIFYFSRKLLATRVMGRKSTLLTPWYVEGKANVMSRNGIPQEKVRERVSVTSDKWMYCNFIVFFRNEDILFVQNLKSNSHQEPHVLLKLVMSLLLFGSVIKNVNKKPTVSYFWGFHRQGTDRYYRFR